MKSLNLILGDQLFADISQLPPGRILMVEDRALARHNRYHAQKLVLTFAAMRSFAKAHRARIDYIHLTEKRSIFEELDRRSLNGEFEELHTFEPADRFFANSLRDHAERSGYRLIEHENPMFLTSLDDWKRYREAHKKTRMAEFYSWQRRRLDVLLDAKKGPIGGRWSFDTENRRKLPSSVKPPAIWPPKLDETTREVMELVDREFSDHPGNASEFCYPVTTKQAEEWLEQFLDERLDQFGDYEDAIPTEERTVFHGVLTPMLNIGLLTPRQVLDRVMARNRERAVPLNSLEGFVRQLSGWREFIRGIDRDYGDHPPISGPFKHQRELKQCWYDGTTGLPPLDLSIQRTLKHGWAHHIERLMIIGAAMFMSEVNPRSANTWFMEMFIDASEWVMRPNVIGMSQFADGGLFATKPYFSGSAYILKMSDHKPGPWCDVWDGLYWRTIANHSEFFSQNARMGSAVRGFDRLDPSRRDRILAAAERFIQASTSAS